MPTLPKPQIEQKPFHYLVALKYISKRLNQECQNGGTVGEELLRLSGFYAEYEISDRSHICGHVRFAEAKEFLDELTAILGVAVAIRCTSGFKRPTQIIETLKSINRDPRSVLNSAHKIDPEALGELARWYCRAEEEPGTHFYDVSQFIIGDVSGAREPTADQIKAATNRAIMALEEEKESYVPADIATAKLAISLKMWMSRYGPDLPLTRITEAGGNRGLANEMATIVVPILNEVTSLFGARKFATTTLAKNLTKPNQDIEIILNSIR